MNRGQSQRLIKISKVTDLNRIVTENEITHCKPASHFFVPSTIGWQVAIITTKDNALTTYTHRSLELNSARNLKDAILTN